MLISSFFLIFPVVIIIESRWSKTLRILLTCKSCCKNFIILWWHRAIIVASACEIAEGRKTSNRQEVEGKRSNRERVSSYIFSEFFQTRPCPLDAPSFFELFHSGERRNARARPAKFLWNLSLGPGQVQIRLFARETRSTSRIIILTDRDLAVLQSLRYRQISQLRERA